MIVTKRRKRLCILLICANLAFIWGNSLMTGTESGALSGGVLAWINAFLNLEGAGAEMLHHIIRKAAHFTEFACLGMLLAWHFGMADVKGTALGAFPLLDGLLAACIDETIQIFVDGRASDLMDVWTDTFGVLTGITILLLGHHLRKQ